MDQINALLGEEEALTYSALLHRIYPLPRDTRSLQDFQRRRHQDIPEMDEESLQAEVFRCQLRIWLEEDVDHRAWLLERKLAAQAEVYDRIRTRNELNDRHHPVPVFGPLQPNETTAPGTPPARPNDPYQFKFKMTRKERLHAPRHAEPAGEASPGEAGLRLPLARARRVPAGCGLGGEGRASRGDAEAKPQHDEAVRQDEKEHAS